MSKFTSACYDTIYKRKREDIFLGMPTENRRPDMPKSDRNDNLYFDVFPVGPLDVNCHVLGCREHRSGVIVDPGDTAKTIISRFHSSGLIPKFIINTHGHFDHVGAVAKVREGLRIPFYIHEDEVELLTSEYNLQMAKYIGVAPSPPADRLLLDGETVDICPHYSILVLHTPGHTKGGCCLKVLDRLITGDTLFRGSVGRTDLPGGNGNQLLESIRTKILPLEDSIRVYPGHGPASTVGEERRMNPYLIGL